MKNFILNYKTSDGEEKEIAMRLNSADCIEIEKTKGIRMLDYIQDYSITTIVTLLKYAVKGGGSTMTQNMAFNLYDELIDSGFTMADILTDVIYEVAVVSGIISEEDLKNIKNSKQNAEKDGKEAKNTKK